MKNIRKLVFTILILAAMSLNSLAGDYADLKVIGFSEDGKYLAFEESGEWDGTGGEYATTYYIDTAKNSFAIAPTVFERPFDMSDKSNGFRSPSLYKKSVAGKLNKLGIVRGTIGWFAVAHFLTDLSFVKPVEREHDFYEDGKQEPVKKLVTDYEGGFIRRGGEIEKVIFNASLDSYNQNTQDFYELTLTPTLSKGEACGGEAYKFELTLKDNTRRRATELQILQKDGENLPERRSCPFGYKIEQVYVYQNKIAVFLNVFSQGFEGPDMRYMVVTGELKYQ